jgi:hypothetical protein
LSQKPPEFWEVVAEFAEFPKGELNVTDCFFEFLGAQYPEVSTALSTFLADDDRPVRTDGSKDRQHRDGWDSIVKPGQFASFLAALERFWPQFAGTSKGICELCKEPSDNLEVEHAMVVSWDFGPTFKLYHHYEMDGSVARGRLICRKCARGVLAMVLPHMDPDKRTCVAFGNPSEAQKIARERVVLLMEDAFVIKTYRDGFTIAVNRERFYEAHSDIQSVLESIGWKVVLRDQSPAKVEIDISAKKYEGAWGKLVSELSHGPKT